MNTRSQFSPCARSSGLFAAALLAGCSSGRSPSSGARPPIFGGEGATIPAPAPAEQPLPAAAASAPAVATGPCGSASPPSDTALLDDFEDGDLAAFKGFQREGYWFSASDPTEGATISPAHGAFRPERLPPAEGRRDDVFAAHLQARGQRDWGAVFGVTLRWASKGIRCPLNASSFAGIRFRAKGPGAVRVAFGMPETEPSESGGTCTSGCYDLHTKVVYLTQGWDDYVVPWNRLEQGGWGTEARFDPSRLVQLQFAVKPSELPADFWVDDIAFVTASEAAALLAAEHAQPAPPPPAAQPALAPAPAKSAPTPAPAKPAVAPAQSAAAPARSSPGAGTQPR